MLGLRDQAQPLHHAEAVLLVDDGEAEVLPFDVLFDQRVRADTDMGQAFGHQFLELRFFALRRRAGEQNRHVAQFVEQVLEIEVMLAGQDFGGRQHRRLVAVLDGDDRGLGGHQRFAAADVALQQAAHGMRRLHVLARSLRARASARRSA